MHLLWIDVYGYLTALNCVHAKSHFRTGRFEIRLKNSKYIKWAILFIYLFWMTFSKELICFESFTIEFCFIWNYIIFAFFEDFIFLFKKFNIVVSKPFLQYIIKLLGHYFRSIYFELKLLLILLLLFLRHSGIASHIDDQVIIFVCLILCLKKSLSAILITSYKIHRPL